MTSHPALTARQRQIVTIAWITYGAYYLGRVNISTALPVIQTDLDLSRGQLGLISSGFFWAYALGQLINGPLGDKISPRRFIFIGLIATAVLNLVFGFLSIWVLLFVTWTINGYFQATGWGPTLRILANWLSPDQRSRISTFFGSCFVAGNALTWLLTGWLVAELGWRSAFWIPGLLLILVAFAWRALVQDSPQESVARPSSDSRPWADRLSEIFTGLLPLLRRHWSLALASACLGFVLVSLIVWTPTYFVDIGGYGVGFAGTISTLLPFAGIAGVLAFGWLLARAPAGREIPGLILALLGLAASFIVLPSLPFSLVTSTLLLMVISALAYGATSLQLSTLPLLLGGENEASSTAGMVDFSFNIGAGISGALVGAVLDVSIWSTVFYSLALASAAAAMILYVPLSRRADRKGNPT